MSGAHALRPLLSQTLRTSTRIRCPYPRPYHVTIERLRKTSTPPISPLQALGFSHPGLRQHNSGIRMDTKPDVRVVSLNTLLVSFVPRRTLSELGNWKVAEPQMTAINGQPFPRNGRALPAARHGMAKMLSPISSPTFMAPEEKSARFRTFGQPPLQPTSSARRPWAPSKP